MTITIDCTGVENARQLHEKLQEALSFPDWYGCNLDALYDCLTAIGEETELVLENFGALPFPVRGFAAVMEDARKQNPKLHIRPQ